MWPSTPGQYTSGIFEVANQSEVLPMPVFCLRHSGCPHKETAHRFQSCPSLSLKGFSPSIIHLSALSVQFVGIPAPSLFCCHGLVFFLSRRGYQWTGTFLPLFLYCFIHRVLFEPSNKAPCLTNLLGMSLFSLHVKCMPVYWLCSVFSVAIVNSDKVGWKNTPLQFLAAPVQYLLTWNFRFLQCKPKVWYNLFDGATPNMLTFVEMSPGM